MFVTQGAAAKAKEAVEDALLVAYVVAVAVTDAFLQHAQDPLTLGFVLLDKQTNKQSVHLPMTHEKKKTHQG